MEIFLLLFLACLTQATPQKREKGKDKARWHGFSWQGRGCQEPVWERGQRNITDLQDQVFLFPKRSTGSYVLLKPSQNRAMDRFTICLSYYSDLPKPNFGLFSASSRAHANEILIFKEADGYEVSLRNQPVVFKVPKEKTQQAWEDLCVAWDSATGILQLWLNRVPLPRKVVAKGYRIQEDLVILLGQDQDSYGGSLAIQQAFEGELGNVYLWDTVLSADQMRDFHGQEGSTPLLNWLDLSYEIKGEVMVVPSLF